MLNGYFSEKDFMRNYSEMSTVICTHRVVSRVAFSCVDVLGRTVVSAFILEVFKVTPAEKLLACQSQTAVFSFAFLSWM